MTVDEQNIEKAQKIQDKMEYIGNATMDGHFKEIFPNGLPESLYYLFMSDEFNDIKKKFSEIPPEVKERFPNGFPEEIKCLFRDKQPAEIIAMFMNGVPQPLKDVFPDGAPESLKKRYEEPIKELKKYFNKETYAQMSK